MKIASPPDNLITYALGSCVGICLLDTNVHVGGLAHIMLPEGKVVPGDKNVSKFADTAIPELVKRMEKLGARRARMKAKIAGGAKMFEIMSSSNSAMWQIGERNVASVKKALQMLAIPIMAQDILLDYGRTVSFNPATGIMTVKAINRPTKDL